MPKRSGGAGGGAQKKGGMEKLGVAMIRKAARDTRERRKNTKEGTGFYTADMMTHSVAKYTSVTEANSLEDFMAAATLAERKFVAEKQNMVILGDNGEVYDEHGVRTAAELAQRTQFKDGDTTLPMRIPRRPRWEEGMAPAELKRAEDRSFLEWRRDIAREESAAMEGATTADGITPLQSVGAAVTVTPYEKNIEVWRQLWRVIERSDVVIQVIDARNPLMFRCPDLELYVKEVNERKQNLLVVNKSDFLSESQRLAWGQYFVSQGIDFVFFSAKREQVRLEAEERMKHGAKFAGDEETKGRRVPKLVGDDDTIHEVGDEGDGEGEGEGEGEEEGEGEGEEAVGGGGVKETAISVAAAAAAAKADDDEDDDDDALLAAAATVFASSMQEKAKSRRAGHRKKGKAATATAGRRDSDLGSDHDGDGGDDADSVGVAAEGEGDEAGATRRTIKAARAEATATATAAEDDEDAPRPVVVDMSDPRERDLRAPTSALTTKRAKETGGDEEDGEDEEDEDDSDYVPSHDGEDDDEDEDEDEDEDVAAALARGLQVEDEAALEALVGTAMEVPVDDAFRARCRILNREELLDFLEAEYGDLVLEDTAGPMSLAKAAKEEAERQKELKRRARIAAAERAADRYGGFGELNLDDDDDDDDDDEDEDEEGEGGEGGGKGGGSRSKKAKAKAKAKAKKRAAEAEAEAAAAAEAAASGSASAGPTAAETAATARPATAGPSGYVPEVSDAAAISDSYNQIARRRLVIGTVGYPNVGKSSLINVLMGATASNHFTKRVSVGATPGKTKHFQTLLLSDELMLCDCPGLVFPSFVTTRAEMVVNGVLPIDQMRDHVGPVSLVCQRVPRRVLERAYGIHIPKPPPDHNPHRPPTVRELLDAYCSMRGFMASTHAGTDHPRGSRYILKDFMNGRLLYVHAPPQVARDPTALRAFLAATTDARATRDDGTIPTLTEIAATLLGGPAALARLAGDAAGAGAGGGGGAGGGAGGGGGSKGHTVKDILKLRKSGAPVSMEDNVLISSAAAAPVLGGAAAAARAAVEAAAAAARGGDGEDEDEEVDDEEDDEEEEEEGGGGGGGGEPRGASVLVGASEGIDEATLEALLAEEAAMGLDGVDIGDEDEEELDEMETVDPVPARGAGAGAARRTGAKEGKATVSAADRVAALVAAAEAEAAAVAAAAAARRAERAPKKPGLGRFGKLKKGKRDPDPYGTQILDDYAADDVLASVAAGGTEVAMAAGLVHRPARAFAKIPGGGKEFTRVERPFSPVPLVREAPADAKKKGEKKKKSATTKTKSEATKTA